MGWALIILTIKWFILKLLLLFIFFGHTSYGDLSSPPRIKAVPLAVEA